MTDGRTSEQLVAAYTAAAAAHGRATEEADPAVANRSADAIAAIHRELRKRDELERLLPLLEHPEGGVRCWAGGHLLAFAPARAKKALKDLASEDGLVAMAAEVTLEEWSEGRLKFS